MIIAHYSHRLPANYDTGLMRTRAKERGPLWDTVPELYFKVFLLRESGRYGATANSYSSLYLWRQDDAFRDFLVSGRYKVVTDIFGRAGIQTRFALDARMGHAHRARFVVREDLGIPLDADLSAVFASEVERNREVAERSTTVAAAVGVDTQNWTFTRTVLLEDEPLVSEVATSYEILHLAKPLLDTLPFSNAE
ncbi:hypothetical protein EOS_15485 [Caballeronia mineralivorans PML1(12)]|uniref:DUF4865 domain-containing protein n=1 Tax=Caballeronia mineralivorans PML1(12) TaxID=908627 RepID=A0A0J1CXL2_9BURK|nr:DUF4865 family protein [Caballeronia mineralivorans]KLU25292.1 hypothetical protein EOS_15485 [Caballeronia mineralivorans PML1(12)]